METTISGRHLEITPAIRDYAQKRISKLGKYNNRIQTVAMVAAKIDHHQFEVEFIVTADRAEPFIAKVKGEDIYASIDQAMDKLERQLTDHKDMTRTHLGKTSMSG